MKRRRDQRKDMQLCAQVRDALELALMDVESDALDGAWVREVLPNPDTSCLLVIIEAKEPERALALINSMRGQLRHDVADAIYRKRTPELTLRVVPPSEQPTPSEPPAPS